MADFFKSLPFVLENEGGKCDIPGDFGGRTNAGVSTPALRNFNSRHPELRFPDDPWALTNDQIAIFYKMDYWKFNGLDSQSCATKIFDMGVNMGLPSGIKLAQKSANLCGQDIAVDACYGPRTEAALNSCDPTQLMDNLIKVSCSHYDSIVENHPGDQKFINGWLRRARLIPN